MLVSHVFLYVPFSMFRFSSNTHHTYCVCASQDGFPTIFQTLSSRPQRSAQRAPRPGDNVLAGLSIGLAEDVAGSKLHDPTGKKPAGAKLKMEPLGNTNQTTKAVAKKPAQSKPSTCTQKKACDKRKAGDKADNTDKGKQASFSHVVRMSRACVFTHNMQPSVYHLNNY